MKKIKGKSFNMNYLNTKFSGPYGLLKFIIKKYGLYNCKLSSFICENNYVVSASSGWRKGRVPSRVWNLLHKDLILLNLMGLIKDNEVMTLEDLKKEFETN